MPQNLLSLRFVFFNFRVRELFKNRSIILSSQNPILLEEMLLNIGFTSLRRIIFSFNLVLLKSNELLIQLNIY